MRIAVALASARPVPAVAVVARLLVQQLAKASGAAIHARPLLQSVRKNAAKDQERDEDIRRLVLAVVSVGTRVRNAARANRLGLPLVERQSDIAGIAVLPGVVRTIAEIGARRLAV